MKTLFSKITFIILLFAWSNNLFSQTGQLKVRSDEFIQIGYSNYKCLTFGIGTTTPNNGQWGIEHFNGGLNFWKPFPTTGAGNYFLFLRDDGGVGINSTGSSTNKLTVGGDALADHWYLVSDEKLKRNIKPISKTSLYKIKSLQGVSYQLSNSETKITKETILTDVKKNTIKNEIKNENAGVENFGFLAQDVKKIMPNIVVTDENGTLAVDYIALIPLLVEAIKEQSTQIDSLKNKVSEIHLSLKSKEQPEFISKKGIVASLVQNYPNPFSKTTIIEYNIQSEFNTAEIMIFDNDGNLKKTLKIIEKGKGSFVIDSITLSLGSYYYSLVVNEVIIDTKHMILQNR